MAYDPNSLPKDLRHINVTRTDDPHIATATTSGRAPDALLPTPNPNPNPNMLPLRDDVTSPPSVPFYYTDASRLPFVNPAWSPLAPTSNAAYASYTPTVGTATPSDQATEDASDASLSGKKVKFLCSFGGKILPRPSDGMLRYVGGQTRIISVRPNVTFNELLQKMVDTYGQPVTIKYQLPFEDLDALVSVSCPDDLDNMMEEYHKLLETSPDGSAKLRVFLFSASDLDPSGMVHFGDLQDSGHKYVDAVNGVTDAATFGALGGAITRKESIASVASTQNSDLSGTEVLDAPLAQDNSGPSSNAMVSPGADFAAPDDNVSRLETSAPPIIAPSVVVPPQSPLTQPVFEIENTVPLQAHGQQQLQGFEMQQPGVNFPPPPSPYLTGFQDPRRDAFSCGDYQKVPPQMVYANRQVLGTPKPVLIQPQYRDNGQMMTQQFVPAVQLNVSPSSSHLSVNPNIVQPFAQQQRVVAVPADQTYINAYPPQVGGGYGWHQVTSPEHMPYSEGWMPHQQAVPMSADCYMCQKALPHAHSDTILQDQKGSHSTMGPDTNPIYHSLRLDDISRIHAVAPPMNHGEIRLNANVQAPYGAVTGNIPSSRPEDALHQQLLAPSSQPIHDPFGSKPVNGDGSPVGNVTYQIRDQNPYIARSAISHENVRPVQFVRENFQTKPSDAVSGNEQNRSPVNQHGKVDVLEQGVTQNFGKETMPNVPLTIPSQIVQPDQHVKHTKAGETAGLLDPFDGLQSNPPVADIISPSTESKDHIDDASRISAGVGTDNLTLNTSVNTQISPQNWVAMGSDATAHSLFSNQDPWNMMPESHYPPPKPTKITMKRETSAKELLGGETNLNKPTFEQVQAVKGSAEDHIKQQLQATAEGVAASVLNSSQDTGLSVADYSSQDTGVSGSETGHEIDQQDSDEHIQTKMEAIKLKPEKANLGFPMSDGMGQLQIIKNCDLEELRELGSGTFGTVYHGKWRGTDVAIKRINDRCFAGKASEQERMRDDFWSEAKNLADLHHPNVVAFYGVVLDGPGGTVATVTEYMVNGSLRTALQKNERNLDKRKRLLIAMDVAFGMEYLHSKNIVHFDLKSDNLLVNLRDPHRPICKVGDLGLSKVKCQTLISGGVRGTLPWMAPELLNGSNSLVSEKVDVFSFGIVMWELLTGEEPYADLHYGAIIGGIVSNTLRPAVPENCDPNWRILMEKCWSAEPSERPNFTEIANELRAMASKFPPKGQAPAANSKSNA